MWRERLITESKGLYTINTDDTSVKTRSVLILGMYGLVFGLVHAISLLYLIVLSIPQGFTVRVYFNAVGEGWLEVGLMSFTVVLIVAALIGCFRLAREHHNRE